jgi:hypothetical protein
MKRARLETLPKASGRARTDNPELLPKTLPGAVCAQLVRCGRPNCRCAHGDLHGPYWYHFHREGGRLLKRYVRREDVEAVRAACDRRRDEERQLRALVARGKERWRRLLSALREVEQDE